MNIADYILIAFVLLMIIIGLSKGFIKMAISFLSGIVAFFAAFIFARPIAGALESLSIFDGARERIEDFFIQRSDTTTESIESAIMSLSVPDFIRESLLENFSDTGQTIESGMQTLSESVFELMLLAIAFIILLVGIRVALYFAERVIQGTFSRVKILDLTNRILGASFSVLQGALIIYIVLGVIALASSGMETAASLVSESLIVSRLYYNNFLLDIFI